MKKCFIGLCLAFSVFSLSAKTIYVDAARPDDSGTGLSWTTAKKSIQAAIGLAVSSDTIVVTNGIYAPISVTDNRAILIRSVNGAEVTIVDGGGTSRCAELGHFSGDTNTVLTGFTLRNGYALSGGGSYAGTLNNCTLSGNTASQFGGGSYYGTLNNCTLSGNTSSYSGGGSSDTTLNDCMLSGNMAQFGGGSNSGSNRSPLNNCTLFGNTASVGGGGSCGGTLNNCTLFGNTANDGGGSYVGTLTNCIVWGNFRNGTTNNYSASTFDHSCTWPLPAGTGSIASDPLFVNAAVTNLRLRVGSPCINSGSNVGVSSATDLDGNPRIMGGQIDMGSYESPFTNQLALVMADIGSKVYGDAPFQLAATGGSSTGTVSYLLVSGPGTVSSSGLVTIIGAGDIVVQAIKAGDGTYNSVTSANLTITVNRANQKEFYVDAARPDDSGTGLSWATAKKSIQAAIGLVTSNDTIVVTNGLYAPISIIDNRAILIRSVNGAGVTIIDGGGSSRCATLGGSTAHTNTVLTGFTLRNGTNDYGGGSYGGTLNNCTLSGNTAGSGGGSYYGTLNNCTFSGNTAGSGGGLYYGTLNNCTLSGNTASQSGGGSYRGTLNNCTLFGNTASSSGGGSYYGTLNNCIVWGNFKNGATNNYSSGTFTNSCTLPLPSGGKANIAADPLFVNALVTNLRLRVGSPCINAGLNTGVSGETDLDGNPRIIGGQVDMGCYESPFTNQVALVMVAVESKVYGDAPFQLVTTGGSGTGEVSYSLISGPGTVSSSGWVTITGAGNLVVQATKAGDDSYNSVTSANLSITVNKASQAALVITSPGPKTYGNPAFQLATTGGNGIGTVSYLRVSGPGTVSSSGRVTITGAGEIVVQATKAGDATYNSMTSANLTITVSQANQSALVIISPGPKTYGSPAFQLATTGGSSTGTVSYLLVSGPGTVSSSGLVTITVVGNLVVQATKAGNDNYNSVTSANLTITVNKATQTALVIASPGTKTYGDAPFQLVTTGGSSTGTVSYLLVSGPGTVSSSGLVTITGAGDILVQAMKAGDDSYNSVTSANLTITVNRANQTEFYVDAARPDDSGTGLSWATAKKSIQAAIGLVFSNDTIVVTNGIYAPISITNNLPMLIRSVNGAGVTLIDGGGTSRCAELGRFAGDTNTVLTGFTLRNGYGAEGSGGGSSFGTLNTCRLSGNTAQSGGGSSFGTLNTCTLSGNTASSYGGGSYNGTLNNCTLSENTALSGGGSYNGTLNNCTFSGNMALSGGGSYNGTLNNCTLSGNTASFYGGGSYVGTLINCIVWGNFANGTTNNYYNGTFSHSCTGPLPSGGEGNIAADPLFVNAAAMNLRLQVGSPCINTGSNADVSGTTDLDGNPRIIGGQVDMGCFESPFTNQVALVVVAVGSKVYDDAPFQLTTSGGSGTGAVSYLLVSGPGTVSSSGLVTITGWGNLVVQATKAGDDSYNSVTSANLSIRVNRARPTLYIIR